ncbi:sensor domain-containing diguanylate cyclase [Rhodoplanes sp. Z2-YC6860]|uniref:sensor domain-containing diguanylate cyclase n=1 Tax=Rhodoplanes sp. Z2-YC6860 TaxID=674703 RepID=UPI0018DDD993|nr:sensor domain-containing diguanylate cyclase [Rhodoplanes sp. Z2-YC6860]
MRLTKKLSTYLGGLSVRVQIGLAAAALCTILVASTATTTGYFGARHMSGLIRQDLAATAEVLADQLSRTLGSRYHEVGNLSRLAPLQPLWQGDPAALRKVLESLQASYSDYSWIGFADPSGNVVAATGGLLEKASVAERPWFKKGMLGPTVEDVHEAKLLSGYLTPQKSGEPFRFVDVAFPVQNIAGETIGVLGAHLSWNFAAQLRRVILDASYPASSADILILSRDGKVLLGATLGSELFAQDRRTRLMSEKTGHFVDATGGERSLVGFATVEAHADYPGLGWMVAARQSEAVALAPVHSMIWTIAGVGFGVALIGLVLAIVMARSIAAPIRSLTAEADGLGRAAGPQMLSRHGGSLEVEHLSTALRSLLRRIWVAEERTNEAERRAAEGAEQYAHDIRILRTMADTDPLTNLLNRRAFLGAANDAFEYYKRYDRPIAALVVDIDHFKKVNDTYGHAAGDAVIKQVGELLGVTLRSTDKLARFGGEEFVILLREVDEEAARALANRARESVSSKPIGYGQALISVTVSIGVTLVAKPDRDIQDTIERADRGLYMAKNTGRNRAFLMYPNAETDVRQVA